MSSLDWDISEPDVIVRLSDGTTAEVGVRVHTELWQEDDPPSAPGTIIEVTDPDYGGEDEGRSYMIYPCVTVKWDDYDEPESFQASLTASNVYEFEFTVDDLIVAKEPTREPVPEVDEAFREMGRTQQGEQHLF